MKKITFLAFAFVISLTARAQTTATDFNRPDCNGNTQHLFAQLDSNHVAFLEFFMLSCSPCVTAGQHLEALRADLNMEFPGMINAYSIGFNDSYSCANISNWVSSNSFTTIPMDSGAYQVAYYGGFGMPTIAVVAGSGHQVLFSNVGFSPSDTATMGTAIRNFFASAGVSNTKAEASEISVFPQPATRNITISLTLKNESLVTANLFSIDGRLLRSLRQEKKLPGKLEWNLDITGIPAGAYFIRVSTGEQISYKKILIN